jgi:UDP-N-acetylmuramoyl-L-alanyl-D-glutamate--2,6-diaminopimelate ligase
LTRPGVRLRTLLAAAGLGAVGVRVCPGRGVGARPGASGRETSELEATEAPGPELTDPEVTDPEVTDPEVTDIVIASDLVSAGALFGCVPGSRADGHDYAGVAVEKGAVAVLCERPLDVPVPQVEVPSVRRALGSVSAAFWAYPAREMKVVGVTGTNGKTTTCALLASIFEANGWRPGVIGTLTGERTTPEAPALQRQLAGLRDAGAQAVAMEVSSHALDQGRVNGTDFSAGVFTNLSQDHLDYHHTMDAYFCSKAQLFTTGQVGVALVNDEDPWGARLVGLLSERDVRVVTFGASDATEVVIGAHGSSFQWRGRHLELSMRGRLNVANAVAAATTAWELGVGWEAISTGLASVPPVRGRFEAVDEGQSFEVLVDFAHTPAALGEALRAARELAAGGPGGDGASGRVILVFGAGGNRDRAKRPLMGKVASELADLVVITSDNPRDEKPLAIIEEVANGAGGAAAPLVDVDRAQAILSALQTASAGDVVLIAGKGHETGQDFGTHIEPFDDAAVARETLRRLRRERKPDKSGVGAR